MKLPEDEHPDRRSVRLKGFDYSQAGLYFVTICTRDRRNVLGKIVDGNLALTDTGLVVRECWLEIPFHFAGVQLDTFVIMPNHVHGVLAFFKKYGSADTASEFGKPVPRSLAVVVGTFKAAVSRRLRSSGATVDSSLWQRNYFEHVIRSGAELMKIQKYIAENPAQWEFDKENPKRRTCPR